MFHDPTFWVLLAFVIVLVLFGKKSKRFILSFLDKRITQIEEDLEEAQTLSEKAQDLFSKALHESQETKEKIQEITRVTKEEVIFLKKEHENKIKMLVERKEGQLNKRIQNLQEQSLIELRIEIAHILYETCTFLLKEGAKKEASHFIKEGLLHFPKKVSSL